MTPMQFAVILTVLLLPVASALFHCLAMLERIEKHLRVQHVALLGSVTERTNEEMAIRRKELGLDDGYPFKQGWQILFAYT